MLEIMQPINFDNVETIENITLEIKPIVRKNDY
jgi:hypothetical protein